MTPSQLEPKILLNMVAACSRVKYPAQMLKAAHFCSFLLQKPACLSSISAVLDEFSHDQLCKLTKHLAETPLARVENKEIKEAQLVQFLVLHIEEIYNRKVKEKPFRISHFLYCM